MKNDDLGKIPSIRFKGFTNAWEQRRLGAMGEFKSNGVDKKNDLNDKPVNLLNYMDVYNRRKITAYNCKNLMQVTAKDNQIKENDVRENDVFFTPSSETADDIGKVMVIEETLPNTVYSYHLMRFRPHKKTLYSIFPNYLLETNFVREQMRLSAQGVQRFVLNKDGFENLRVFVPSYAEQQQIGAFFKSLDHLITLHQRKLDKTKELKKTMLSKMFPKNGEDKPELRFSGFTDAWELRRLGKLMEITSVKRIHQSDWTDSGVRFLRARDVVSAAKGEKPANQLYISEEKYNEYSNVSGKVQIGDLLVTGVGSIGVPLLIRDDNPLYFKDGNIIWFKNQNNIDGNFFYYSFIGNDIQKYIRDVAGTGTVGTYTIDSGKKTPIFLPDFIEQNQIGLFFQTLDNLITLHQRELEKLKNIKKTLLKNMFV